MKLHRAMFLGCVLVCVFFCASCTDPDAYTFAVVGDFQQPDGGKGYKPVSHKIVREIAAAKPEFVVIVGDLIAGRGQERWQEFDELVKPITEAGTPIHAVIGNNDLHSKTMGEGFDTRFTTRRQVVAKPGLWLVLLDSEQFADGYADYKLGEEQTAWLNGKPWRAELAAGPDPLLFFVVHRPVWRSKPMERDVTHKYGRDKPEIASLLERLGADVVLGGHEHLYERIDKDNATYFITGGGGGKLIPVYGYHHFMLVTISPNKHRWSEKVVKVDAD
ncbi:MAG: metallophosphoesterase [Candidatus Lernaella stagnicola]|nr:metallophosphoesterase [Candidatus Lernaella stagnicola]